MAARQVSRLAAAALLLCPATAQAADVLVLKEDGSTVRRHDPGVAARDREPRLSHPRVREQRTVTARTAKRRTAMSELRRHARAGRIPAETFAASRRSYRDARRLRDRASGLRQAEMAGQLRLLNGIAARGRLSASRVAPLWLQLQRNREWWGTGPLLVSGARVSFEGSQLIFQYFPGQGLQIHPLGNFGKLNGLWGSRGARNRERMTLLLSELLAIRARRAGGVAWEYYFDFGGGSPPWVSGLAQGTAVQSLTRASKKSGAYDLNLPILKDALAIFRRRTPVGVRVKARHGIHYAQYSYAPSLRILNGFAQAVTGLFDYAEITGDPEGRRLYADAEPQLAAEVPRFDTGAWSLYSRGSSTRESDLNYHVLLKDFLENLCDRTAKPVYCGTAESFVRYTREGPRVRVVTKTVRANRTNALRFRLSKISRVSVTLRRGGRTVLSYGATLGHGTRSVSVSPPRGAKRYKVSIAATDLAGNTGATTRTVRIRG